MIRLKLSIVLFSFLLITACSSPDQEASTENNDEMQMQLVNESDSLSNDLSAASDSIDMMVRDLQTTLDDLNN